MADIESELVRQFAQPGPGDHDDIAARIGAIIARRRRARRIGAIVAAGAGSMALALIVWAAMRPFYKALPADRGDGLLYALPFAILAMLLVFAAGAIATALTTSVNARRPD